VSNNSATATISGNDLFAINFDAFHVYRVTAYVEDNFGNAGSDVSANSFLFQLYPVISTVTMSWGSELLKAEKTSNGTVTVATSNVIDGKTLTVVINGVTYTTTVTSNAASVTIPSADLTAITPGSYNCVAQVENKTGYADSKTVTFTVPRFEVLGDGDSSHGYWIAGSGNSKIIVAPKSYESSFDWGNLAEVTGATSNTDGKLNCVTLYNNFLDAHAAAYAVTLPLDPQISGGNQYANLTWYLPSLNELTTCMTANSVLPVDQRYTLSPFPWEDSTLYWTSSESSADRARIVYLDTSVGLIVQGSTKQKDASLIVRPIRIASAGE
jgi:hypothetical protein